MKDLDINFPLDKFEKLIIDIGWESLDDWFNFWNNKKNILSIDQYWNNKVNDDWIWGLFNLHCNTCYCPCIRMEKRCFRMELKN